MSERKFYQKITDIYATALDYDKTSKTTKEFFTNVQNKLHWAIHRHTAAEIIVERSKCRKAKYGTDFSGKNIPMVKFKNTMFQLQKNYLNLDEIEGS